MAVIALLLALIITAFAQIAAIQSSQASQQSNIAGAALVQQATSTPASEELSEIGSTNGIVVMGGVIALIVFLPIVARYKDWMRAAPR